VPSTVTCRLHLQNGIVEEEADECLYWMEMLIESGLVPTERIASIFKQENELVAIVVTSIRTARGRNR
jgi:hypothetical protein